MNRTLTSDEKAALLRDFERLKTLAREERFCRAFIQHRLNEIEQQHDTKRVRDLIASVRRFHNTGDFILAFGALDVLNRHINKLNQPLLETGAKIHNALDDTRNRVNAIRHNTRAKEWDRWQTEAKAVWRKDNSLSNESVAAIVKRRLNLKDSISTIRQRIKKPAKAG